LPFLFTGELKTLALLDRERVPVYNLIARATDGGGRFCQSDVHLILEDVNDSPPVFSSDHYNACVYENTATKALLTRVQAVDPDVGKSWPDFCLSMRQTPCLQGLCPLVLWKPSLSQEHMH
jgi:hypothetical protein